MELNDCFFELSQYQSLDEDELTLIFEEIFANLSWPKKPCEIYKIENNLELSDQKIKDLFQDLKENEKQYYRNKAERDKILFEEYKTICGNKIALFHTAMKYLRTLQSYRDGQFERKLNEYLIKLF